MRGSLEGGEALCRGRNLEVKIEEIEEPDIYRWFLQIFGGIVWLKLLKTSSFFSGPEVSDSSSFGFNMFQTFIAEAFC